MSETVERMLPLYEAKLLHHYDHRWATYTADGDTRDLTIEEKQDPNTVVMPRYWVSEDDIPTNRKDKNGRLVVEPGVASRLSNKSWDRNWLLGWRDICRSTDERTMVDSVIPSAGVGHPFPIACVLPSADLPMLCPLLTSFVFDYVCRQKIGGTHLTYGYVTQMPVLAPETLGQYGRWLRPRILELTYAAYDMTPFARDLGHTGEPFIWDEERRAVIRAELDALFFHLYGISRDDTDYILDTFPIIKRKDEAKYGSYRTKELILAEYDRMAAAGVSLTNPLIDGENYNSTLRPPPGHGPRHPAKDS